MIKNLLYITPIALLMAIMSGCVNDADSERTDAVENTLEKPVENIVENTVESAEPEPETKTETETAAKAKAKAAVNDIKRKAEPRKKVRLVKAGVTDTLKCEGAVLYIFENSLKADKEISVTALTEKQLPHIPESMVNVTGINAGYRFLPHGEHFTECNAVMGIPFDTLKIPAGYTASDIRTYYYSEKSRSWEELAFVRIDKKGGMAYAATSHFTDVINGILKVPESPETGAVAPTFIQDYRPVSPLSAVNMISAPVPSSTGDAKISYRFRLPEGRGGVMPDLLLSYSSGAASGYVGYGFTIPVEKIEIDTRWGVPQFGSEYETECYMLNGETFTKKAHNHFAIDSATIKRQSGDVRFYLRTGGEGLEIVRHGSTPKDYSWTVTDKAGTVKTFTGFESSMESVSSSVTPKGSGNIIEWVLTKVKDSNGNTIEYKYINYFNVLYPLEVEYTGHEEGDAKEGGYYKVQFHYPKKNALVLLQDKIRPDAVNNRRMGINQTDMNRLDSLTVTAGGAFLRSYALKYAIGPFSKLLLTSVTEYDTNKKPFYTHSFSYHNNVADGQLFGNAEQWTTEDCGYGSGFLFNAVKPGFEDELSMIGGSSSDGWSVGGGAHVSVGFGNFVNVYSGASYNYSSSESKGRSTLADINGDGIPDLVFLKKDTLCYRAGKGAPKGGDDTDSNRFGPIIKIKGAKEYSKGKSECHNLLVDAGAQFFFISGNACYSHNWQKNSNTIYLNDFNADGLIDIGYNGKVLFNHINPKGEVEFSTSSKETPCPIPGLSVEIDKAFVPDVEAEKEKMAAQFPLHDVVRVWRAPYTGHISIQYQIRLSDRSADGVICSIQQNDILISNTKKDVKPGGYVSGGVSCYVKEGDMFYFRVQSKENAIDDDVTWPIKIEYSRIDSNIKENENGSLLKYSTENDFLFCGVPDVPLQREGSVHVSAPFSKGELSDNITLAVTKNVVRVSNGDTAVISTDLERRHLDAANVHKNEPMDIYLTVSKQDVEKGAYLSFRVESASQINWERVDWKPVVTYNDEPEPFMYVAPHFTMYNHHVKRASGVRYNGQATVAPRFIGKPKDSAKADMKVNFSLKDSNGRVYYSGSYTDGMTFQINTEKNVTLYGSFHTDRDAEVSQATFRLNGSEHEASVFSAYDTNNFGHLYRGWGQFAYRGEGAEKDSPIKEELLHFNSEPFANMVNGMDRKVKPEDIDSTVIDRQKMSSLPKVNDLSFFTMSFVPKENRYVSIAKNSYVSAIGMASSRIGKQTLDVDVPAYPAPGPNGTPGSETACPHLTMSGEGNGFTGSASAIAQIGGGFCNTTSYTDQMLHDINGDGYPDWINRTKEGVKVQLTGSDGRLTNKRLNLGMTPSKSRSEAKNLFTGVSISSSTPDLVASIGNKGSMSNMTIQRVGGSSESNTKKGGDESNKGGMSLGISGDFGSNSLTSEGEFVDVNGDGLPDYMTPDGKVRYNVAGEFNSEPVEFTKVAQVFAEESKTAGAGVGVNVSICGKAMAGGGASASKTSTYTKAEWRDINGDGLPDYVYKTDDGILVGFNTGTGLGEERNRADTINVSASVGRSASCNVAVPIPIVWVTLTPSTAGGTTKAVSSTNRTITDVDGDGYPDLVESRAHNQMRVRRSRIGNTNLLKTVTLPTGANIEIDYAPSAHSVDMPRAKRVMSKVEIKECGLKDTIIYSGGVYNRCERTFCGYDTVSVQTLDAEHSDTICRTVKTAYSNHSYYTRHLPLERTVLSSKGVKMESENYSYTLKGDSTYRGRGIFAALTKQVTTLYGNDGNLTKTTTFDYDEYGNLTKYNVDSDLDAKIEYHKKGAVRNIPSSITVSGLAERSSQIDDKGNITKLTVKTGGADAVYDMEYDKYGNVIKQTRPDNGNGERVWIKTTYDGFLHAVPTEEHDSYGRYVTREYDPLHLIPVVTQNNNGDLIMQFCDACGRIVEETRNKDYQRGGDMFSMRFEYNTDGKFRSAKTIHNTPDGKFTVTNYTDEIGRSLGYVKPCAIYSGGTVKTQEVHTGMGLYDAMGRRVTEYKPSLVTELIPDIEQRKEYDALDRIVSVTQANGAKTTYSYAVTTDQVTGKTVLSTTVTDPNGNKTTTLTDSRGRSIALEQQDNGGKVRTTTEYDALNRPVKVTHPNGTESTYSYDMQGNLTSRTTPDAGTQLCTYTPLGQPMERTTATGDKITYQYSFDRLTKINYPDSNDNVIYTYADSTVKNITQRCRLIRVDDASGAECYIYGDMGVIEITYRLLFIDKQRDKADSYISSATYDSWGRIREMIYPDGEKVTYSYYPTGELKSIVGQNNGKEDVYLKEAGYNLYGQTVYRHLGNGSKELFTFDENNRLETSTLELQGQTISTNTYRYDKADNITDIMQTAGAGGYLQHYEYDGLNRLVKATGRDNTPYGDAQYSHYTMEMAYNAMSSPVKIEKNLNGTFIRNEYLYGLEEHPNAPQQVGDRRYTYSASGNPLTIEGGDVSRTLTWDAENRLRRIYDSRSGQLHLYTYNHLGERALKRYGKAQAMAVNDKDAGALLDTKDNYSAYVSPYFVGHNNRYTKHYYAGAMRIASKMGASGSTYAAGTDEPDLYFYHTDHLGSTTYITDRKEVAQYVAYTPYGETFKEYKNVTPYKFNGKELDQETGYYYYGARYYAPSTALWFGTDPLADINPQNSPYVYCKSNPIIRIDPDGMKDYAVNDMDGSTWHNFDTNNDAIILDEVTKVKPHVDQEYGQTVTGGYDGKGSDATSRFHGPSIDASDLGYSFDGWGSRGMEYGYNLLQRFRDLFESFSGSSQVEKINVPRIMEQTPDAHNNDFEGVKYYPVIQGPFNDHGVIRTKNFRNHHGDIVSEGDTAGCRIVTTKRNRSSNYIYKKDTVIYMSPKESREFFKANKIK